MQTIYYLNVTVKEIIQHQSRPPIGPIFISIENISACNS